MPRITRCDRSVQSIFTAIDADSGPDCSFKAGIERVIVILARTVCETRDENKSCQERTMERNRATNIPD